ncbi:MAG: DNA primase [Pseudomonadota bacterium]
MPRFNPEYLDELKARLRPSDVIGRHVQLKKRGALWWGLSPFKTEKTPSFAVNDERRSYHCYSTDNHGDIIKFLQETQNLSFVEAVTRLAGDAGMEIPADDPRAADKAKERKGLADACVAAAAFFSAMLKRREGTHALDYVRRRGISEKALADFTIGYSPRDRRALTDYLINKGYAESQLVEAGLSIKPDDGGRAFDRFRDRVMFPITGTRGEVIAFGGRALDPAAKAKYLNSPETPIFRKSEVLYNYETARGATARNAQKLLVCEGYMDVIALADAGFKGAVAPLGTALTEKQIGLLWRLQDEPVLCFDGDEAGKKAAYRAVDRAIPSLKPGKSLSFVFLPDGKDPDDIVREGGPKAFSDILGCSSPLVDVLWRREAEVSSLNTPERKAAFRTRLRAVVKGIADPDVRNAYAAEIVARFRADGSGSRGQEQVPQGRPFQGAQSFGKRQVYRSDHDRRLQASKMTDDLKSLNSSLGVKLEFRREATLALAAVRHPSLILEHEDTVLNLKFSSNSVELLISDIIAAILIDPDLDSEGLTAHVQKTSSAKFLESLLENEWLNTQSFLRHDAELSDVKAGWHDALRLQLLATSANAEIIDSASRLFGEDDATGNEEVWKAVTAAREALANTEPNSHKQTPANDGMHPTVCNEETTTPETDDDLLKILKRAKGRFK